MRYLLFALFTLLIFVTCRKENVETLTMPVCFDTDILPIFVSNCALAGCHDAATQEEEYQLDNYEGIMKGIVKKHPIRSEIYNVICLSGGERAMPPSPRSPLTDEQKNKIRAWISQGAQNTSNCNFSCDTAVVAYSNQIKKVMANYCTGCHNSSNPNANLDLTTYTDVNKIALNGKMFGTIEGKPSFLKMPPSGSVGNCDILKLKKWIAEGAKNN